VNSGTTGALRLGAIAGLVVVLLSITLDWGWGATATILAVVVVVGIGALVVGSRGDRGGAP